MTNKRPAAKPTGIGRVSISDLAQRLKDAESTGESPADTAANAAPPSTDGIPPDQPAPTADRRKSRRAHLRLVD